MKKEITIVIPVYNSEKYLSRCIDSILNQTCKNFEVLIINDGSTDNSLKIIEEYSKKYPRIIKYVTQKNIGVAKTRNKGINLCKTKYIMFVDNDDYLDCDYVSTLYNSINSSGSDMVISGYKRTNEHDQIISSVQLVDEMWSYYMIMTPWAKIFNREFLKKNSIYFLDNNIGEDIYFNLLTIHESNDIKILPYVGYNWFFNTNSVSNTTQKIINKLNIYKLLDSCYDELKNRNLLKKDDQFLEAHFIRYIYWFLFYSTSNCDYSTVKKEYNNLFSWLKKRFPNYKKNKIVGINKPKCETKENKRLFTIIKLFQSINLCPLLIYMYNNYHKIKEKLRK